MQYFKSYDQLVESLSNTTFYHGTAEGFSNFDTSKYSTGVGHDDQGKGIYLTDSLTVARYFAALARKNMYLKSNGNNMQAIANVNRVAEGAVLEVQVAPDTKLLDLNNDILDLDTIAHVMEAAELTTAELSKLSNPHKLCDFITNRMNKNITGTKSGEEFVAKYLGYDGVRLIERGMDGVTDWSFKRLGDFPENAISIVIYNPSKVSISGTIQDAVDDEYDPNIHGTY